MLNAKARLAACAVLITLALSGCGGSSDPAAQGATTLAPTVSVPSGTSSSITIVATDDKFEQTAFEVPAGQGFTLTVRNSGQHIHEVEVKDILPETQLSPGQSKTIDVPAQSAGTHRIYCEIHGDQGMEGTLTLK